MITMDEMLEKGLVDEFLEKVQEKCNIVLKTKKFAGLEREDVAQEILIKVYRSMSKFDKSKATASTFVDYIISNVIKDIYRKAGSKKNLSIVNALSIDNREDEDTNNSIQVGTVSFKYENTEIILDIMNNMGLDDREKEVFRLRAAGFEFEEIGNALGLTKSRISQIWTGIKNKYNNI